MSSTQEPTHDAPWNLLHELGGEEALRALLRDFYDRVYDDVMIGFFFAPHPKQSLIDKQYAYLVSHLGEGRALYHGRTMRQAHMALPILPGHFDRRHTILKQTLARHEVPPHVQQAWLQLEQWLRPFVLRMGKAAREA